MDGKRVMAFGTFDGFHEGHKAYLSHAATYGDLTVVIARDATTLAVKGRAPLRDEETRRKAVEEAGYHAVLGSTGDKYALIEEIKPDVICLGYDQVAFTEKLTEALMERGLHPTIVRAPAHHPDRFKSSILDRR